MVEKSTYFIDIIDRKLLAALDRNSRETVTALSKRLRMPRNIVEYRLKKLRQEGIITKFVTEVALGKIGFSTYKIYCQISGLSKENQERLYRELMGDEEIVWVAQCEGRWDLLLAVYARNVLDFARIKKSFLLRYGRHITDYAITIVEEAYIVERGYLTGARKEQTELYIGGTLIVPLSDVQKKMLVIMTNDARIRIVDFAEKLGVNVRTVMHNIQLLEQTGVIQGYTTFLDVNKLGLLFFKSCIFLKEMNTKRYQELLAFCKQWPAVVHVIEAIGPWELELEIEVPGHGEMQELSTVLRNRFADIVKKVEMVIITKEWKLEFLPKMW